MAGTQRIRVKSTRNSRKGVRIAKVLAVLVLLGSMATGAYLFTMSEVFSLNEVVFHGNRYLSDAVLKEMADIKGQENLFVISSDEKARLLMASPWIKDVSIRKEFPRKLMVKVDEAVPQALLRSKGKLLLVDAEGTMLEELKGEREFFLPVIVSGGVEEGRSYREALKLAGAVRDMGFMGEATRVEITGYERGAEDLSVSIDGLMVLVGEGEYEEKLTMLMELAEEIKTRMSDMEYYVDMRFDDRVVVKPISTKGKPAPGKRGA